MDDLTEGQEPEEDAPPADATDQAEFYRRKAEKANKEAHKLRTQLRRTEVAAKYGEKIAGLIPDELPVAKYDEFAEKLAAELPPRAEGIQPDEGAPAPAAEPAAPTPEGEKLGVVAKGSGQAAPGAPVMSHKEWLALLEENPTAAMAMRPEQIQG